MKILKDRGAAGKLLADRLQNIQADLVLGIPRGGVTVAYKIARQLNLPLDIIVTRKIGAPSQEELALGAIDPDEEVVWDKKLLKELKIENGQLTVGIKKQKEEIKRREKIYRQDKRPLNVSNKTIILVDDGMATGSTVLSAINYLKRHKAKVILAVPVASKEALEKVKDKVKQVVALEIPEYFQAVGEFYQDFQAVTDKEVIELLNGR